MPWDYELDREGRPKAHIEVIDPDEALADVMNASSDMADDRPWSGGGGVIPSFLPTPGATERRTPSGRKSRAFGLEQLGQFELGQGDTANDQTRFTFAVVGHDVGLRYPTGWGGVIRWGQLKELWRRATRGVTTAFGQAVQMPGQTEEPFYTFLDLLSDGAISSPHKVTDIWIENSSYRDR